MVMEASLETPALSADPLKDEPEKAEAEPTVAITMAVENFMMID
jgi:hypothetical protein